MYNNRLRSLRSNVNWRMMGLLNAAARGDKEAQQKLELLGLFGI